MKLHTVISENEGGKQRRSRYWVDSPEKAVARFRGHDHEEEPIIRVMQTDGAPSGQASAFSALPRPRRYRPRRDRRR